jgi:DNA-binding CsgD family transcriptional regulator
MDGRRVQGYSSGVVRIVTTHLRARGVTEFLQNPDAMRCWGALRRARSGQEARTIASAARTTVPKAQSALECLASIGLAEPIGAHAGTRRGKYRSTGAELVVRWLPEDAGQRAAVGVIEHEHSLALRDALESLGARAIDRPTRREARTFAGTVHLTARERAELSRLVVGIERLVIAAQRRDDRRAAEDAPANVAISVTTVPVAPGTPPTPCAILVPEDTDRPAAGDASLDRLSTRERQVAVALALGMSRKEVAAETRLAEGTIITLSRRIYRKLGVHNRAELATRLGGWSAPAASRG